MDVEIVQYEVLAKDLLRRCMAEEAPEDLHRWITEQLAKLGGGDTSAVMTWPDSVTLTEKILDEYERLAGIPEGERLSLKWPWESWNKLIDPLEEGMLGVITAPDGVGKTIYAESLAEYWAQRKNKVVFVHYELNRKLMMLRRVARWTGIPVRKLKAGQLTPTEKNANCPVTSEVFRVGWTYHLPTHSRMEYGKDYRRTPPFTCGGRM